MFKGLALFQFLDQEDELQVQGYNPGGKTPQWSANEESG
jgi:hypothetical protein